MDSFHAIDWLVIAIYFGAIGAIAWWVVKQGQKDAADYFLASRHVGWYVIGASIFASNIGSEHIVGLASTGANSGVALAHYELHSWCVLLLGSACSTFLFWGGAQKRATEAACMKRCIPMRCR